MTLAGEQFRAVQYERFDADQDFAILRARDRAALDFEYLRSARFVDHCGLHRSRHSHPLAWFTHVDKRFTRSDNPSPLKAHSLPSRWVGGGETVTCDLPCAVRGFLENEEFLIRFSVFRTRGVVCCSSGRIRTRENPV